MLPVNVNLESLFSRFVIKWQFDRFIMSHEYTTLIIKIRTTIPVWC